MAARGQRFLLPFCAMFPEDAAAASRQAHVTGPSPRPTSRTRLSRTRRPPSDSRPVVAQPERVQPTPSSETWQARVAPPSAHFAALGCRSGSAWAANNVYASHSSDARGRVSSISHPPKETKWQQKKNAILEFTVKFVVPSPTPLPIRLCAVQDTTRLYCFSSMTRYPVTSELSWTFFFFNKTPTEQVAS